MAYTDLATVRAYIKASSTADDTLLTAMCLGVKAAIDKHCGRTFEAAADTTRTLTSEAIRGQTLHLDADLAQLTSVVNGDGEALDVGQIKTKPRNETPYYALQLPLTAVWYALDIDEEIAVTGRWAYSVTAPDDIKQAATRLVSYWYKLKDAAVFDVTVNDMGQMVIPKGIPGDVIAMLKPYKRISL